jgi:hypothetical protein
VNIGFQTPTRLSRAAVHVAKALETNLRTTTGMTNYLEVSKYGYTKP